MESSKRGRGRPVDDFDPAEKWNETGFDEGIAKIEAQAWADSELEERLRDAVGQLRTGNDPAKVKQAVLFGAGRLIRRGLGSATKYLKQPEKQFYREFLTCGLEGVYDALGRLASGYEPPKTYRTYLRNQISNAARQQFERDVWHRRRIGKKKRYLKFQSTADESRPPKTFTNERERDRWEEQFHDSSQACENRPTPAYLDELRDRWGEDSRLYKLAELLTQDGMTNREAAELLNCSRKTIERHRPKVEAALVDIRKDYGYGRA